jgi:large subunit ribosomal protein L38e
VRQALPSEITDAEEFVRVSERASECRVKRLKDIVKLKLRTRKSLYTFRVDPEKAAELLKQIKCEVIEA